MGTSEEYRKYTNFIILTVEKLFSIYLLHINTFFLLIDFEKANRGCCGTGLLEATFMCNPNSYVCPNASKYVFWDSIHPTEKTYYLISQTFQPTIDSITK